MGIIFTIIGVKNNPEIKIYKMSKDEIDTIKVYDNFVESSKNPVVKTSNEEYYIVSLKNEGEVTVFLLSSNDYWNKKETIVLGKKEYAIKAYPISGTYCIKIEREEEEEYFYFTTKEAS